MFALRGTNFGEVGRALTQSNFWLALPFLGELSLFVWLKAVRWRMLLTPLRANTALEVFPALMIGFIGNNLLPAHLEKFVRTYILARQLG